MAIQKDSRRPRALPTGIKLRHRPRIIPANFRLSGKQPV
jgi:hypothetical protein